VTCRTDTAGGFAYRFCPDDPPPASDRLRIVLQLLAIDEITQRAPEVDFTLTTRVLGLTPRVAAGGRMGLVGNPARLFPGLNAAFVQLDYTLAAPGYLSRSRLKQLGPIGTFPATFAPADDGVIPLHRTPIVLRGRVAQLGALDPTPLAGASVSLAGVWSTFPPSNVDPNTVIEAPNLVSLHPGLYADRAGPADSLRRRDLVLAAGEEKALLRPAVPGDTQVRISDSHNLAATNLLAFETARPDRVEYVTAKAVHAGATDDEAATIDLDHPLAMGHEEGTLCVRATPQPPGAANAFGRDGNPGDQVAFLAGLGGLADDVVVEIGGGTAPVEYQTARLYAATSDAEGAYRLPPLSRVASVKLHVTSGALAPQQPVASPDYRRYENFVDVLFP
jgi:hypothetical protein